MFASPALFWNVLLTSLVPNFFFVESVHISADDLGCVGGNRELWRSRFLYGFFRRLATLLCAITQHLRTERNTIPRLFSRTI